MTRSPLSRRTIGVLALLTTIALAGCASTSSSPSSSAATSSLPSASAISSVPPSEPASAEPTSTATAVASVEPSESLIPFACVPSVTVAQSVDRAQISDVRVGTHDGYDRVTFQFVAGIPQTVIEGVLPPFFADPSGLPIEIEGKAFLKVVMNKGTRFLDGGLTYGGSINFTPGFPQLVQLREGGDFEAVSNWYIGLNAGACFRVMALTSPARLVIDIEQ